MLVTFYKIALFACIQTLVPNRKFIAVTLPVHQQAYILDGALRACYDELKSERMLACTENSEYCQ